MYTGRGAFFDKSSKRNKGSINLCCGKLIAIRATFTEASVRRRRRGPRQVPTYLTCSTPSTSPYLPPAHFTSHYLYQSLTTDFFNIMQYYVKADNHIKSRGHNWQSTDGFQSLVVTFHLLPYYKICIPVRQSLFLWKMEIILFIST